MRFAENSRGGMVPEKQDFGGLAARSRASTPGMNDRCLRLHFLCKYHGSLMATRTKLGDLDSLFIFKVFSKVLTRVSFISGVAFASPRN